MQKISAVLPDELAGALEQRARAEDRSASAVVRIALAEHLTSPLNQAVTAPLERVSSQTPPERGGDPA